MESVLTEEEIYCPYCGERIVVLVDPGDAGSTYVEDCQVCCRPIVLAPVLEPSGEFTLHVQHEDD